VRSLASATTYSDNAVFAAVGIKVGTKRVAKLARRMGIRTPVSHNLAMTLGGLRQGVTALDMAHAYETFARGGKRITGTLGAGDNGPVGISEVRRGDKVLDTNKVEAKRIVSSSVADQVIAILRTVVTGGTGTHAQLSNTEDWVAGKTGTTENYGDAWFVGFTPRYTTAVWVGYPDKLKPMETEYNGAQVSGGTYPADIWHDIMTQIYAIDAQRENARRQKQIEKLQREGKEIPPELQDTVPTTTDPSSVPVAPSTTSTTPPSDNVDTGPGTQDGTVEEQQQATQGAGGTGGGTGGGGGGGGTTGTPTPTPATPPTPTPDAGAGATGGATPEAGGAAAPPG